MTDGQQGGARVTWLGVSVLRPSTLVRLTAEKERVPSSPSAPSGSRSLGNMGAFLVVQAVGTSEGSDKMDAYKGLAQRSPVLALSLLVFLLSLGGIPFVAGFWAKLFIFRAVVDQQMYALALLGAVATIVALYYYLVLSSRMYVDAPEKETPVAVPMPLLLAILVCAVGTVVMGMYPEPWVQAVMEAAKGLF